MRTHYVKKARKDQGECSSCGSQVKRGDSYKWIKFAFGPRKIKCGNCDFRPSEKTNSKMGAIWDAQEDAYKIIAAWEDENIDDLSTCLNDLASIVREVSDEYRESADNMPENLQNAPVAEECREKADELEAWADEIESVDFEEFEFDIETAKERGQNVEAARTEAFDNWVEEQRNIADDIIGSCPV